MKSITTSKEMFETLTGCYNKLQRLEGRPWAEADIEELWVCRRLLEK